MGHRTTKTKNKLKAYKTIESRTDFFYYAFRNILLVGLPLTIISGLVLSHLSLHSSATSSGTDNLTISIYTACTLSSTVNNEHNSVVDVGTYKTNIGKTTITTLCNDGNGYSIYANGFSNDEEGNNKLINSSYPQYSIDTGLATSGLTSTWAMKLNNIENDPSPTPPTIDSSYNDTYGLVPTQWTKVAYRQSGTTDMSQGSSFTTTYSVYASSSQYNGTYNGQVKYVLIHPYKNDSTITTVPTFEESFALAGKEKITVNGTDFYTMQDMSSLICERVSNTNETPTIQLVDIRDNKLYWVAKLDDGHCWMTQNLDFDIVADTQDPTKMKALTSEDTDLIDHSLTGAYSEANGYSYDENTGIISWTPASTAKTINFNGTTVTGWQNSNTEPYSANKTDDANTGHASLGNYYNWTAAIASNNSSTLANTTYNDVSQNPQNSICPKGWRLPTVSSQLSTTTNSTNEFARLNYLYNNNSSSNPSGLIISPLYFIQSGHILSQYNNDGYGDYWSSTNASTNTSYYFYFNQDYVSSKPLDKKYGFSIRCLAK